MDKAENHQSFVGKTTGDLITDRGGGGRFKTEYELLNLRALKMSMLYKKSYLSMYG